jgi:hypothetical protein
MCFRFPGHLAASILFVLAAGSASPCAAVDIHLSPEEAGEVDAGKVVLRPVPDESVGGQCFEAVAVVDAGHGRVYEVLTDFGQYPSFMPNVSSAKVLEQDGKAAVVEYILSLPLGKVKMYRLRLDYSTGKESSSIRWKMVPWPGIREGETIHDTSGYWLLKPYGGRPDRTLALYHVFTDPGPVPAGLGWIVDALSKNSLPKAMRGTRARVAEAARLRGRR